MLSLGQSPEAQVSQPAAMSIPESAQAAPGSHHHPAIPDFPRRPAWLRCLLPAVLWLLPVAGISAAGGADEPPVTMTLEQVSAHVYYVHGAAGVATDNAGFTANAAVVVGQQGVLVFDALGTPALGAMLLQRIREVTDLPIRHLVLSHYHADHIYGLQSLVGPGIPIWAPAGAQRYLEEGLAQKRLRERRTSLAPWVNATTHVVPPDHYLAKEQQLLLGAGEEGVRVSLQVLGAAHSTGDLVAWVLPDRVLLSGDVIFAGRLPYLGDGDSKHWLAALEQIEKARPTALIPGHGKAVNNPLPAIQLTRRYLAYLRQQMGAAVAELTPFDEAYRHTDWSTFASQKAFAAANRGNAYRVYLSMEQEALSAP